MLFPVFDDISERFLLSGRRENGDVTWNKSLIRYYNQLKEDGLLEWTFIAGGVESEEDMVELFADSDNTYFLCVDSDNDNRLVGACQLTNRIGQAWTIHFSILRKYHKISDQVAQAVLHQLCFLREKTADTRSGFTSFVHTFIGITPKPNRAAIKFLTRNGFKIINKIPRAYYWKKRRIYVPGVLSIFINPLTGAHEAHSTAPAGNHLPLAEA